MKFTYKAYGDLLNLLRESDYKICSFHDYSNHNRCAILRHDVDQSLEKAVTLAEFENRFSVYSTYFILLTSDFYNIASIKNSQITHRIKSLGHNIGLHFDEVKYYQSTVSIHEAVENEIAIMTDIIGIDITSVSMHRPSMRTLDADYEFCNAINTYSKTFINELNSSQTAVIIGANLQLISLRAIRSTSCIFLLTLFGTQKNP